MSKTTLKHRSKSVYNFEKLCAVHPELIPFVFVNAYETKTIDFGSPKAVKALNTALLFAKGKIKYWEFPDSNLCPPIPGRQSYIDRISLLLEASDINKNVTILDIGTGATCIYPLLGNIIYNWRFVGTDIDERSLKNAQSILDKNGIQDVIELRIQKDASQILTEIVTPTDRFSAVICNPPFYKDEAEAEAANAKKIKGLGKDGKEVRNFAGTNNELIYKGGEKAFLHNYLYQSSLYKTQCFWFSSLVSNKKKLKSMQASLKKLGVFEMKLLDLRQGNKQSRVLAWTFLNKAEQKIWKQ
ncbi:23S rRNA (adenine(1618)-N(6))-methyltransferase [Flavobacteriales bacterium 34_180_T64]|nr:23S rRNA (adenine(1618)-N(6))-methyltransferase [Flavobacteriales bacterium 34_180_T64]